MKSQRIEKRTVTREVIHQVLCFERGETLSIRLDGKASSGRAVDISSGGMGIITQQCLRAGDVVTIRYPIHGMKTTLPVFAEVMWQEPVEDEYIRAGLCFLG